MKVSVIIPTLNRIDDLRVALNSLFKQTLLPDEVWIIDQSEDTRAKELVENFNRDFSHCSVRLEYLHQSKKSTVHARKVGLARASGDILAFLDDDVELFEDYFEKMADYFENDPRLGGVGGNVLLPMKMKGFKWTIRKTIWRFFLLNNLDGRMTPSGFGYPVYEREIDCMMEVEMLQGCAMSVRRDCLPDLRFDEWFTGYSYREDVEFSYRIYQAGWKLLMVPDMKLYHHQSPSNRLDSGRLRTMQIKNYYYVFKKFKKDTPLSSLLFFYSLFGGILIDFIECWSVRDRKKTDKLKAAVKEAFTLMHD